MNALEGGMTVNVRDSKGLGQTSYFSVPSKTQVKFSCTINTTSEKPSFFGEIEIPDPFHETKRIEFDTSKGDTVEFAQLMGNLTITITRK